MRGGEETSLGPKSGSVFSTTAAGGAEERRGDDGAPRLPASSSPGRLARWLPLSAAVATSVALLVVLRAELVRVPYLNDSAMAEEMVRFALQQMKRGHFPPGSWFPFLNLGSPQYLHYQSLGAMLTALLAWPLGVGRAFTLVTWLLLGAWPLCVYGAARVLRLPPAVAAGAALLAPFLSSFTEVGYEQIGYTWSGYGLFSQEWAMWTLPFAWAFSWRAVDERRYVLPAAIFVAATACFHFETGYLAFLAPVLFVFARRRQFLWRLAGAALVLTGAGLLASWAIVPLIADGKWAAINQLLQHGPDVLSYGAARVASALGQGDLLDWHHFPIVSLCALAGSLAVVLARMLVRHRLSVPFSRVGVGLLIVFAASLVLFIGPRSLPFLVHLVPGGRDIFFRRFVVGVQLSGLFLAGAGAVFLLDGIRRLAARAFAWPGLGDRPARRLASGLVALLALAGLAAGWSFVSSRASLDSHLVALQARDAGQEAPVNALIERARPQKGRLFAGDPSDFGTASRVGEVQMYKYLTTREADEVGFTLRTASLMSDPEVFFDEDNPADYNAFGIHWLLMPAGDTPPVPARKVERRGAFELYSIPGASYAELVYTRSSIDENAADLATFARSFLPSLTSGLPIYPTVSYDGAPAARPTLSGSSQPSTAPGDILGSSVDLAAGRGQFRVKARRRCVLLFSVSYDPGWQATVDGHPAATEMLAPALLGVTLTPGAHLVSFVYRGYPDYGLLAGVVLTGLVGLLAVEVLFSHRAKGAQVEKGDRHREPDAHEPEDEHPE